MKNGNMQVIFEFPRHKLVHFEKKAYKYLVLTILNLRA